MCCVQARSTGYVFGCAISIWAAFRFNFMARTFRKFRITAITGVTVTAFHTGTIGITDDYETIQNLPHLDVTLHSCCIRGKRIGR